jgi:molecular chaperone DnaK
MKNYVGIDLGTTNSAICSYDGENLMIYTSPEQHKVTPSAVYIDRRSRYFGVRAYRMSAFSPDNVAVSFKRLMGTNTPILIPAMNLTMTPEQCSAEILKVLFGYLPEDMRNDQETGTVITVPAAFNQMQRDATMAAAEMAGIGKVALMQEPVAAVMSVMRSRKSDGIFLIYDLGGGTFDIALAQSISRRVSLLDHGGITMCGGRDFDKSLVDNVVKPWLLENFDLPGTFSVDPKYRLLPRLATWASEQAKIELSAKDQANISLPESEIRIKDRSGNEIYLDIPIDRKILGSLIENRIIETIEATREVLTRAVLTPNDIDRIVFVGGPTQYKPTRDMVSFQLGITADTRVDAMTAVAEGAAIFAESIDWSTPKRYRKSSRGSVSAGGKLNISFEFIARTPDIKAIITAKCSGSLLPGAQFQIDSIDTGWTSGRMELKDGTTVSVILSKYGENKFKVFVFDPSGGPISLEQDSVIITRTMATVEAIPASHSLGVEIKEKISTTATKLEYLVHKGNSLPHKGIRIFKSGEALRANGPGALIFKLYEGEIENPVHDNEFVGCFKITGTDFESGVIQPGDDLIMDYEVSDAGKISISVSVPSISGTFSPNHDFYSRQEGQIDFLKADKRFIEESEEMLERVNDFSSKVEDARLETARNKLLEVQELVDQSENPEACKQASENIKKVKKILAQVRKDNLSDIRQSELDFLVKFFKENLEQIAKPTEITAYQNMAKSAQRAVRQNLSDFENITDQMRGMNWQILWRQDWFIIDTFKRFSDQEYMFINKSAFRQLIQEGSQAMNLDNIDDLRKIVLAMYEIRITTQSGRDMLLPVNILAG